MSKVLGVLALLGVVLGGAVFLLYLMACANMPTGCH